MYRFDDFDSLEFNLDYHPYGGFYHQFMDGNPDKTFGQILREIREKIDSATGLVYPARSVIKLDPECPIDQAGVPDGLIEQTDQVSAKSNFLQQVEDFMRRYKLRDKYMNI